MASNLASDAQFRGSCRAERRIVPWPGDLLRVPVLRPGRAQKQELPWKAAPICRPREPLSCSLQWGSHNTQNPLPGWFLLATQMTKTQRASLTEAQLAGHTQGQHCRHSPQAERPLRQCYGLLSLGQHQSLQSELAWLQAWFRRSGTPLFHLWLYWSFGISAFGTASVTLTEGPGGSENEHAFTSTRFFLQGVSWLCLLDSTPGSTEVSGSPRTEKRSCPYRRSALTWSQSVRRWTIFLAG